MEYAGDYEMRAVSYFASLENGGFMKFSDRKVDEKVEYKVFINRKVEKAIFMYIYNKEKFVYTQYMYIYFCLYLYIYIKYMLFPKLIQSKAKKNHLHLNDKYAEKVSRKQWRHEKIFKKQKKTK